MTNTSKPKCVVLANSAWNIYNYRVSLIQALKEEFDVWVMANDLQTRDSLKGVQIVPLSFLDADSTNPFRVYKARKELRKELIRVRPDIVIAFTLKPAVLAASICKRLRIPLISVVTGLGQIFIMDSYKNWVLRYFISSTLSKSSQVIVQNEDDKVKLIGMGFKTPIELIEGSGVDTEYFGPREDVPYTFDFLFVGRCLLEKGITELKKAHNHLKERNINVRIGICGTWLSSDPRYMNPESWSQWQKKLGVEYLGTLEDVRPVLASARCVVLPSYREGLSKALLESMSMAVPILTTDVPGCKSLVNGGKAGWLVPPRNAEALADAMGQIMKMDDLLIRKKGVNARNQVLSQYDESIVIPEYISVMTQMIK